MAAVPETAATDPATSAHRRHQPWFGHVSGNVTCTADHESGMLARTHSRFYLRERGVDRRCQPRPDRVFGI